MARIRTVKPEFFQHEELYEAEKASGFPLRIAFEALWCQADREGRFRWRPRTLKLACLPYDELDFSEVLAALEQYHFVLRYEIDGQQYGWIHSFTRHQKLDPRETNSVIPPPPQCVDSDDTLLTQRQDTEQTGRKGKEGKGREGDAREHARATPGLNVEAFDRWLDYREQTKRKLLPASYDAAARKLAGFGKQQPAVVEQSIAAGWQGLFALKDDKPLNGHGKREREPTAAEIAAARRRAEDDNRRVATRLGLENFGKVQ